ncbi:DUF1203 domain-containing protein [Chromobacterium phragmitis]|uniref:DUF1203 domain-containing protein n=1 Tax=Chromobacterium phragmitis TaxID=2202141 RepID=A0A344UJ22_9NEIS|nr:DUF1203 domain-containing protein [Chromobacterium phragmitis]AXE29879.1 DUF1203 domain-containing protein [Chromobacterium phragmitis]AXE35270.1 DUF1203 domain-containing protein [Chromobacterium phragmitis]
MTWRMETLDERFIAAARGRGVDALGQPARRLQARGGEPLRDGLRRARPGERLLLASYSPFRLIGPYREYGPVFLGAEPDLETLPSLDALLEASGGYLGDSMALRAYDAGQSMIEAAVLPRAELAACLARWTSRSDIAFAMLRYPAHGCYALRLNRDA